MNELDYRVAIEALENHVAQTRPIYETLKAIDYLKKAHKEALAQTEQEPVAQLKELEATEKQVEILTDELAKCQRMVETLSQPKEPEQEPVAVKHIMEWVDYLKRKSDYGQHLQIPSEMSAGACWELARELEQFIITPPQRKPLTDEQIKDGYNEVEWTHAPSAHWFEAGVKFSEAAHGIKE